MRDTIYRQDAIMHLKKRLYETALNSNTEHPYYEEIADNRLDVWMNEVPSAQPEKNDKDFEEKIHGMFDHIWDCEIEHPIFRDTVGELMNAVIQLHNKSAQPEIIYCKDCKHYKAYEYTGKLACHYVIGGTVEKKPDDFCSRAERIIDERLDK